MIKIKKYSDVSAPTVSITTYTAVIDEK